MAELTLDEAQKEVLSLRKKLNDWADAYYSKDAPKVEDYVYDQAYNRLLKLENDFPQLVTPDSILKESAGKSIQSLLKLNMLFQCYRWEMSFLKTN